MSEGCRSAWSKHAQNRRIERWRWKLKVERDVGLTFAQCYNDVRHHVMSPPSSAVRSAIRPHRTNIDSDRPSSCVRALAHSRTRLLVCPRTASTPADRALLDRNLRLYRCSSERPQLPVASNNSARQVCRAAPKSLDRRSAPCASSTRLCFRKKHRGARSIVRERKTRVSNGF